MNKTTIQGSGFPASNHTWRFFQSMIEELHSSKAPVIGEKAIITGCVDVAGVVSDGIVTINGEQLNFKGGAVAATVIIVEEVLKATYLEDINPVDGVGDDKDTYFTRYATFGAAATQFNWSDFTRVSPLLEIQKAIVPIGMISMWSGAINAIPAGWKICDGVDGTPNLKGKFIVGYDADTVDYDAIAKQGGAKEVAISVDEMPAHNHDGQTASGGAHVHNINNVPAASGATRPFDSNAGETYKGTIQTESGGAHTHNLTTNNKGGGAAHENRPPYFTLAYIIFVGV